MKYKTQKQKKKPFSIRKRVNFFQVKKNNLFYFYRLGYLVLGYYQSLSLGTYLRTYNCT